MGNLELAHTGVNENKILVDSGASTHIFSDPSVFSKFDEDFSADNVYLELADGSKCNIVENIGVAIVPMLDINGKKMFVKIHQCTPSSFLQKEHNFLSKMC